jgi:hypothetical protein
MAETATQQTATKVLTNWGGSDHGECKGLDQRRGPGSWHLRFALSSKLEASRKATTASLSRLRYLHCPLLVPALVTFQKSRQSNAARGCFCGRLESKRGGSSNASRKLGPQVEDRCGAPGKPGIAEGGAALQRCAKGRRKLTGLSPEVHRLGLLCAAEPWYRNKKN